jgi:hypothetical protein
MKRRNSERGQALMAVIAGVSLVLLSLVTALILTQFTGKVIMRQLTYQGQALNAAQAGLTEGLSWFRRQTTQPVINFAPIRDDPVNPQVNDTEDVNCINLVNVNCVGLVRSYQISAPPLSPPPAPQIVDTQRGVWARYILRRTRRAGDAALCAQPCPPATIFSYTNGNCSPVAIAGTACYSTATSDITLNRGKRGAGTVWQLESEGVIYTRHDPNQGPDYANTAGNPNAILARRVLRSEIQRLAINAPTPAALVVNRGDAINVNNNDIRIQGNTVAAVQWVAATGNPNPNPLPGTPRISGGAPSGGGIPALPDRFTVPYIFGLTDQELLSQATLVASDVAQLPPALPQMGMIVLNDPALPNKIYRFTSARPLTGTGILVVFGNLVIDPNSASIYNGLIFVRGGYTQNAPSTINGTVVVRSNGVGSVIIRGSGERSIIRYDQNLLNFIAARMGLYAESRSPYIPCRPRETCDE